VNSNRAFLAGVVEDELGVAVPLGLLGVFLGLGREGSLGLPAFLVAGRAMSVVVCRQLDFWTWRYWDSTLS